MRPGFNHCLSKGPGRKGTSDRRVDVSGKGRFRQGLDALASSRGSVAWAWLAVLWRPTLSVPVISWLALLTPGALRVVLAALEGRSWVEAGPLETTDPGSRKEGGWDSPGRHLFRAHRPLCGHGSCSVRRCPGRGHWASVCSRYHSPGGRKTRWEGLPQQGPFWVGTTGWRGGGGPGELGHLNKEEPGSSMEGAGRTGGWSPGLTWQDGPRYPGGQVHCSTSSAGSWPVSSGTATSMLMPETLGVARPHYERVFAPCQAFRRPTLSCCDAGAPSSPLFGCPPFSCYQDCGEWLIPAPFSREPAFLARRRHTTPLPWGDQ